MKKLFIFVILSLIIIFISVTWLLNNIKTNKDFKFNYKEYGNFLVPVKIDDEEFLFLLDLGITYNVIDEKLAKKFNFILKNKNNKVIYNNNILHKPKPIKLKIGNYNVLPSTFISDDFSDSKSYIGEDIQGMIGLDIIKRFIWHIDIKNHTITLSTNPRIMDNQQCTNLQDNGDGLIIVAYPDHKDNYYINFRLTTASQNNFLTKELVNFLDKNKIKYNKVLKDINNIINIPNMALSIDNNSTGDNTLEPIMLSNIFIGEYGFLGQSFINQFEQIVINPYDMQFCFVKDKNKKELKLLRQIYNKVNNKNQILIIENNPKYLNKLSLKNKDIIISINGKKYTADNIIQARHMLRYLPNLNLIIKRDNKLINVKLD